MLECCKDGAYGKEIMIDEASWGLTMIIHHLSNMYRIVTIKWKSNGIDYGDFVSKDDIKSGLARVVEISAFPKASPTAIVLINVMVVQWS